MKNPITRTKADGQTPTGMITSYSALPIGKYEQIIEICKGKIDEDALTQQLSILAILTGKTEDELASLPLVEYSELARLMRFLYHEEKGTRRVAKRYDLGSLVLVPQMDLGKITTAQYIDFQTYAKGGEKNIVQLLSCFLVPEGCKYGEGYDVVEVQNAIRDSLSVTDVFSLSAFFLRQYGRLIRSSQTYLAKAAKSLPEQIQAKVEDLMTLMGTVNTMAKAAAATGSRTSGGGLQTSTR